MVSTFPRQAGFVTESNFQLPTFPSGVTSISTLAVTGSERRGAGEDVAHPARPSAKMNAR